MAAVSQTQQCLLDINSRGLPRPTADLMLREGRQLGPLARTFETSARSCHTHG